MAILPYVMAGEQSHRSLNKTIEPPTTRRDAHVFRHGFIGRPPLVEAESAPEAHHVIVCAKVEEAGACERFWLKRKKTRCRVLEPRVHEEGLEPSFKDPVIPEFGTAIRY